MGLLDRTKDQLHTFHTQMVATNLVQKMNEEQWARNVEFNAGMAKYQDPEKFLRDYRLELVPFTKVFDHTRTMLKSLISIVEGWLEVDEETKKDAFLAKSGALLLGEDEDEDLAKLELVHGLFVQTYKAEGLPPGLKPEALRKQVAAHTNARKDMPSLPAGQMLATARAEKRRLTALAKVCHAEMHNFLDSYFGKTGDAAYEKKKKYGYDRRTLNARSRSDAEKDDAESKEKTDKKKEKKSKETPPADGKDTKPAAGDTPETPPALPPTGTA